MTEKLNAGDWKLVPAKMITLDRLDVQFCADAVKRAVTHAALDTNKYSPQEMDLMQRLYEALGKETDPADFSTGLAARAEAEKNV